MTATAVCVHRYACSTLAKNGRYEGRCVHCGKVRFFPVDPERTGWKSMKKLQQPL